MTPEEAAAFACPRHMEPDHLSCRVCARIMQAVRSAVAEEREACAKVASYASVIHFAETMDANDASRTAAKIAAAIRARGKA